MVLDTCSTDPGTAEQLQECFIELRVSVLVQERASGDVPPSHGGVLQASQEQHMRCHTRREDPAEDLVVERVCFVKRVQLFQNPAPRVFAAPIDPFTPSEVS